MVYYVRRKKSDGTVDAYVTEDKQAASKLAKGFEPVNIKEISMKDIVAYFRVEVPEKKVDFSRHSTYKNAVEASDVSALNDYINEAARVLGLDPFHPDRATWENKRKENLQGLAALVAKQSKK